MPREAPPLTGNFPVPREPPPLTGNFPVPREPPPHREFSGAKGGPPPHRKYSGGSLASPLTGNFPVAPGSAPRDGEGRDLAASESAPLLSPPPCSRFGPRDWEGFWVGREVEGMVGIEGEGVLLMVRY